MREYSRVDASIPLGIRLIPEEEKHKIKSRVSGDISFLHIPHEEPTDKVLAEWLKIINAKLDHIINSLNLHQEGFSSLPIYDVNISGGGISFTSEVSYNVGDIVEIKTVLETPATIALYLYGEVVKSEKTDNHWKISVKFINISEEVRDFIIKFVFHRERQILREKREI
ncbi:PilZ domain-containing protein [Thermodesulfovibrio hydrogeniphilus]